MVKIIDEHAKLEVNQTRPFWIKPRLIFNSHIQFE